eukprot:4507756-Pyramimonas_sp.AAC.1
MAGVPTKLLGVSTVSPLTSGSTHSSCVRDSYSVLSKSASGSSEQWSPIRRFFLPGRGGGVSLYSHDGPIRRRKR